jgi:photosystem II stability/assembly factor-like uncharacterized protein
MYPILIRLSVAAFTVVQVSTSQNGWTIHGSNLSTINCMKAVDQNIAWIAGDSGKVSLTTDGGSGWTPVGAGAIGTASVWNIDAINANLAFVTTTPSSTTYIYRTTNGGMSWSQVFSQDGGFIDDIHMTDATTGYAYGDPVAGRWTILKTTDGGLSWARLPNEPEPASGEVGLYYNSLSVIGPSHLWFVSGKDRIYRSTDSGQTWSSGTLPTGWSLSVWFNTLDLGLTSSTSTSGARSTDSGLTWQGIPLIGSGTPYAMAGAGTTDFWFASNEIYRSTDKGSSWLPELSSVGHQWFVLDFVTVGNSAIGYAGSFDGAVARWSGTVTSVYETNEGKPQKIALEQNYPNPFNPGTEIRYALSARSHVSLTILNLAGQQVAILEDGDREAGTHKVNFSGAGLASGVYFYRLQAGGSIQTKKLLLLH